jgi:hypothetical protein
MVGWENGDKDEPSAGSAENQIPIFWFDTTDFWAVFGQPDIQHANAQKFE